MEHFQPLRKGFFAYMSLPGRVYQSGLSFLVPAVTLTVLTVSSALNGFSILFIANHTSDNEGYDTGQYCTYQNCSHLKNLLFIHLLFYIDKPFHVNIQ